MSAVLTIGHSSHSLEHFLELLRQHRVEVLVDARSRPYSRFAPHFSRAPIERAVVEAGLRYLYLGLYIADCDRMRYKSLFLPHERLIDGRWVEYGRAE